MNGFTVDGPRDWGSLKKEERKENRGKGGKRRERKENGKMTVAKIEGTDIFWGGAQSLKREGLPRALLLYQGACSVSVGPGAAQSSVFLFVFVGEARRGQKGGNKEK